MNANTRQKHQPLLATYRTKTQLAYEELRRAILAGDYPPGSRIVADQLAATYGISKVPVREAIVRLVGEGWLQASPHVGATVPKLSPDEVLETSIVRSALEPIAVRLATEVLKDTDLSALRKLLSHMDKAAAERSLHYPSLNFQFHSMIFEKCPYPLLRQLTASVVERSLRLRTVRFLPEYLAQSQREHWALLNALQRREAKAAERITRHHIEKAGELLWKFAVAHHGSRPLEGDGAAGRADVQRVGARP